jgi:hypothetical protein
VSDTSVQVKVRWPDSQYWEKVKGAPTSFARVPCIGESVEVRTDGVARFHTVIAIMHEEYTPKSAELAYYGANTPVAVCTLVLQP